MKSKLVFLLTVFTVCTIAGYSQGFHLGLKGGANISKIDGIAFKEEFNYGYNAGIFAEIEFDKKWGIQPEVLWNQSQTRTSSEFEDLYNEGIGELKGVTLNYLSIPLLLSYRPAKFISFQAGPQVGVLINSDEKLLDNGKRAFKTGDFSVLGGVQFNIGGLKAGARYSLGLNNINNIDGRDVWKNQGFQVYAGFRIL